VLEREEGGRHLDAPGQVGALDSKQGGVQPTATTGTSGTPSRPLASSVALLHAAGLLTTPLGRKRILARQRDEPSEREGAGVSKM